MILAAAVTIIVNGSIVASVTPARIAGGRVVAPLAPVVVRLAARAAYDPIARTVTLDREGKRIVVPVAFVDPDGVPFIEVGRVVRQLGGSAAFDAPTKTLAIVLRSADPISTSSPFDPSRPQVQPTTVFTPAPPAATPRVFESDIPRPRRTAIPVVPSQPVQPPRADPTL